MTVGELVWDPRLIGRERALELVGRWPIVAVHYPGEGSVHFHCAEPPHSGERQACYQSVARLVVDYRTTLEELLAGVLRHAVVAHELDTGSRGRDERAARGCESAGADGDDRGRRGTGAAGPRPLDQASDRPGGDHPSGGDSA